MSSTEIFFLEDGTNEWEQIGETKNAFRSAMYVWNEIAKKYFKLDCFPGFFDKKMMGRIWNAQNEHKLKECEHAVLLSTMDGAFFESKDINRVINFFFEYGQDNPNSSLTEQAEILSNFSDDGNRSGVFAFLQTSVSDFGFEYYCEDTEEYVSNFDSNEKKFNIVEQFDEYYKSE